MTITGIYKGTGAKLVLGLGFLPREVRIFRTGAAAATGFDTYWLADMTRGPLATAGGMARKNATTFVELANTAGIAHYDGGDVVTASSVAKQAHRNLNEAFSGNLRGPAINRWSLDTAANLTGHFNAALDTNVVGVGSTVRIVSDGNGEIHEAKIATLTNDGDAANEVTLDRKVPSGFVSHIGAALDFVAVPTGMRVPAGIVITDVTYANANGIIYAIVATA